MKGVVMVTIEIDKDASYENLPVLKMILQDRKWKLKRVSFIYSPSLGLPNKVIPGRWPFEAYFDMSGEEIRVKIYSLTAGYPGTGPHDLLSILDFLGVKYSKEDILTKRKMDCNGVIRLEF